MKHETPMRTTIAIDDDVLTAAKALARQKKQTLGKIVSELARNALRPPVAVTERAGMRQASMYHHVAGKEELLAELLESTVTPSLAYARELLADEAAPAGERLWELCRTDVELLCGGPHNLGVLYLLPEVRTERFAGFHAVRAELKDGYRQLLAATRAGGALAKSELDLRTDLVFGLIEGVILVHRSDPERPVSVFAEATADAALRIAGV